MPHVISPSELPRYAFGGVIATEDPAHLPPRVRINTPFNNFVSPALVRKTIKQYPHVAASIDHSLSQTPPPESLRDRFPSKIPWSWWLSAAPEHGGATDEHHRSLMQWNLDEMIARNRRHGSWLLNAHDEFTADLEKGVAEQSISPKLLHQWRKIGQGTALYIDGPLRVDTTLASAYRDFNAVCFTPGFSQEIATHEFLHLGGSFRHLYLNEAGPEYLTKVLRGTLNTSSYLGHAMLLGNLFAAANVGSLEVTKAFTGYRGGANERSLRRHIKKQSGSDLLGEHTKEVCSLTRTLQASYTNDEVLALTAMQMMRRRQTYGTDEEVVRLVAPDLDDEQVRGALTVLHSTYG